MVKNKFIVLGAMIVLIGLSSCGIFKKSCNCPHFGKIKCADSKYADVQMIG